MALYKLDGAKRGKRENVASNNTKRLSGVSVLGDPFYKPFDFFHFSNCKGFSSLPVIGDPTSAPTLSQQRTAFLTLIDNNIGGLATALQKDMNSNVAAWNEVVSKYLQIGGTAADLTHAVNSGANLPAAHAPATVNGRRMGSSPTLPTVFEGTTTPIPATFTLQSKPPLTQTYQIPKFAPGNYGGAGNYVADLPTLSAYNIYIASFNYGQDVNGYYGWQSGSSPDGTGGNYYDDASADAQMRSVYQSMLTNAGGIIPLPIPYAKGQDPVKSGAGKSNGISLGQAISAAGPIIAAAANAVAPGSGAAVAAALGALTSSSGSSSAATSGSIPPNVPNSTPPAVAVGIPVVPILIGAVVLGIGAYFVFRD